jgi:hypothetical protein
VCWKVKQMSDFGSEKIILSLPLPDPQVTLENVFNCYLRNTSLFFHNYHLKLFHSNFQFLNEWKKSPQNNQKMKRDLSYGIINQSTSDNLSTSNRCQETHEISIEKNENDQWTKLNLEIQTRVENGEGNESNEDEVKNQAYPIFIFIWKLTFRLLDDSVQISLSSSPGPPNECITQLCHIPTLITEITEMVPLLTQLDEDVSDDWFKLISCSSQELSEEETKETTTTTTGENFEIFAQNLIGEHLPREVVMSINEEINPADTSQLIESLTGEPTAPHSPTPASQRQLRNHECIYFSVKLGINFRIQSNTIQLGSIESSENSSDDFSSIHCLDLTCLESIYENAMAGDQVYVRGLNHTIENRPSKISLILSRDRERTTNRTFVPDDVTREVAAQERFWRIGQDTNQPTYYISAAPVKRTSTAVAAQPSSSGISAAHAHAAVATTAQFASPSACDSSDPRSPSARTPIVANVVVARPLEVFSAPFDQPIDDLLEAKSLPWLGWRFPHEPS